MFPIELIPRYFSLERYHLNGSRILSRSFHVEKWKPEHASEDLEDEEEDHEVDVNGAGEDSAMDIDPQELPGSTSADAAPEADGAEAPEGLHIDDDDESDDEDREDPGDVAMVPMADMLNARFESENVCAEFEFCGSILRFSYRPSSSMRSMNSKWFPRSQSRRGSRLWVIPCLKLLLS